MQSALRIHLQQSHNQQSQSSCAAMKRSKVILPKRHRAPLMSRHLPSLWQQPVSLSSQRDPLYPLSVTSEWMVDLSVPLRPDQRGGGRKRRNKSPRLRSRLALCPREPFFSRRPVEAVTRDRIREVPEERSLSSGVKIFKRLE